MTLRERTDKIAEATAGPREQQKLSRRTLGAIHVNRLG
jgi:hypothetical protein